MADVSRILVQHTGNGIIKVKTKTIKEYSKNRWIENNDTVYNELSIKVNDEDKKKITDFLNMFYYFIICYSKACFKKNANWNIRYESSIHYKTQRPYRIGNTFDYSTSNELHSNQILLSIQHKITFYRKEYLTFINKSIYLNALKITEMMVFINESIYQLCTTIAEPLKVLSTDIQLKINNYKNVKQQQIISKKINYEALQLFIGTS